MIKRLQRSLLLFPAIFVLFVWIAAGPLLISYGHLAYLMAYAALSAFVAAWSITLFVNAVRRDTP